MTVPRIDVKITREDDKIKIKVGKFELKLLPVEDKSQTYDFLALEQFITRTAKLLYLDIVKKDQQKNEIRKAFTETADQAQEAKLVEGLIQEAKK